MRLSLSCHEKDNSHHQIMSIVNLLFVFGTHDQQKTRKGGRADFCCCIELLTE